MSFLDELNSSVYDLGKDFSPKSKQSVDGDKPVPSSPKASPKKLESDDAALADLLKHMPDSLNDSFSTKTISSGVTSPTAAASPASPLAQLVPPKQLFNEDEEEEEDESASEEEAAPPAAAPAPSTPAKPATDEEFIAAAWRREESLNLEQRRSRYQKKANHLATLPVWADYAKALDTHGGESPDGETTDYAVDEELNRKVVLWQGDITTLEVDAIVNAANRSLLGGGGIDGAIHSAAGDELYEECRRKHGCDTGNTKITRGYRLPAKYVLHTVGPTNGSAEKLESCYKSIVRLVEEHGIRSVALCGVATGIYGFPLVPASRIALKTVRDWLQEGDNRNKVDAVIFCTFLDKELRCYQALLPQYFPIVDASKAKAAAAEEAKRKQQQEEEAQRRRQLEQQAAAEAKRKAEEAAAAKQAAEQIRLAEEKRVAEEKRIAEEKHIAEEKRVKQAAEDKARAEAQRIAAEKQAEAEAEADAEALRHQVRAWNAEADAPAAGAAGGSPTPASGPNYVAIGIVVVVVAAVAVALLKRMR